jgi:hypothetical protein
MGISAEVKTGSASGIAPTLRKEREEWGTHLLYLCLQLKGWATRPRVHTIRSIPPRFDGDSYTYGKTATLGPFGTGKGEGAVS